MIGDREMSVDVKAVTVDRAKLDAAVSRLSGDGRMVTTELPTTDPAVFLSVYTSHRGGGLYVTAAMGVRHMPPERGFSITKSSPMHYRRLAAEARGKQFSRKNLVAEHTATLAALRDILAVDPGFCADVLAETPEA
jgi:hypothetical protein